MWPHGLQHTRLPCLSSAARTCSNSCLLSQWCHPTISSSVIPFSSCLQSFPKSGSFLMTHLFTSGGQSWSFSFTFSFSPSNEYSGLISIRMDWFDLLAVQGTPRVFSSTTVHKHQFLDAQPSLSPTLRSVHDYWGEGTQFSVYLPFPKVEAKLSPPAFFAARVQAYVRPNVPSTQ